MYVLYELYEYEDLSQASVHAGPLQKDIICHDRLCLLLAGQAAGTPLFIS
jgi:hypothetical protein